MTKFNYLFVVLVITIVSCAHLKEAKETKSPQDKVEITSVWKPPQCLRTVKSGDFVRYHYYGNFIDGTYFDSSYERGRTYNTYVDSGWLISGMDIALLGMCLGEKRLAVIPPSLAYGEEGTEDIPGNSTLIFDYILLDVWSKEDKVEVTRDYIPEECLRQLKATDFVRYHYNGTLLNGQAFHSSHDEDSTYDTYVGMGNLIAGMDEGLLGACMGEKRTITMPPFLAYGERGDGKNIPASATVIFDVEIIDFHNPNDTAAFTTLSSKFGENCPRKIENTDFIRYHYNGTFVNGELFDSSYQRNHTYDTYIGMGKIIPGMEKGLLGMCVGDRRKIIIPPHIGYGEDGVAGVIPGSAVIVFHADLIDVHNPKDKVQIKIITEAPKDCKEKSKANDYVVYDYSVELMDGTLLNEWTEHGSYIGRYDLIAGFEETLNNMCVGEKRKAIMPPHLGYGEKGSDDVPGSAVLILTVELKKIIPPMQDGAGFLWIGDNKAEEDAFKAIDEEGDGKILLAELASYTINAVNSGKARFQPDVSQEDAVLVMFERLDKNKDDAITKDELDLSNPLPLHAEL